jgi:hypothetical protein
MLLMQSWSSVAPGWLTSVVSAALCCIPGMAVFDTMRHIRPDVSTCCIGLAASMGAFILASGEQVGALLALVSSPVSSTAYYWHVLGCDEKPVIIFPRGAGQASAHCGETTVAFLRSPLHCTTS